MSKLYDAIKKLDNKEKQSKRNDIPFSNYKKENNTKRLILLIFLISLFLISGLFIARTVKKSKNIAKMPKKSKVVSVASKQFTINKKDISVEHISKKKNKNKVVKVKEIINLKEKIKQSLDKKKIKEVKPKEQHEQVYIISSRNKLSNISKKPLPTVSIDAIIGTAENGTDREAISAYKKLIKIFPDNLDLYNNLAVRYMNIGKYKEASEVLRKALSVGDSVNIRLNYTLALVKLGKIKEAREEFKTINIKEVKDKNLFYALASILFHHF